MHERFDFYQVISIIIDDDFKIRGRNVVKIIFSDFIMGCQFPWLPKNIH